MTVPVFKSLIVLVGPRTDGGRPTTCFSFSRPQDTRWTGGRDDSDADEEIQILTPRRLQ